jgi:hypothetical protein
MSSNNKDKIAQTIISIITNAIQPAIKEAKIILGASKDIINELEPLAKEVVEVIDGLEPLSKDVAEVIVKIDDITREIPKRLEANKRKYELNKSIQDNIHNKELEMLENSDTIYNAAKQKADSLTRGIMPNQPPQQIQTSIANPVPNPINSRGFIGGSSIKQIQKGGKQSLNRTTKSINAFLNSPINASYILNMVKKGGRTKRRLSNKYNKTKRA